MNAFFRGNVHGAATVGERGQVVIPADLRKDFNIKSGDKLIVIARPDRKMIGFIPAEDFNGFLKKMTEFVSTAEQKVEKKIEKKN